MHSKLEVCRRNFSGFKIRAKKSLGQNFLVDKNILVKIVASSLLRRGDTVIEPGAGKGALTKQLLEAGANVFAVEIDRRLCCVLEDNFARQENLHILESDILKLELSQLHLRGKAKLIGNLPFYISSRIIGKFLPRSDYIQDIYVTVQKELGVRLITPCGARQSSAFSLFVHFYSSPKILFNIKRTCFRPIPDVDACFVKFSLRPARELVNVDHEELFRLIRAAFNYRRKTVFNALGKSYDSQYLKKALEMSGIEFDRRPETIKLDEYIKLAKKIKYILKSTK